MTDFNALANGADVTGATEYGPTISRRCCKTPLRDCFYQQDDLRCLGVRLKSDLLTLCLRAAALVWPRTSDNRKGAIERRLARIPQRGDYRRHWELARMRPSFR
jgi:hypothetical protein